MSIALRLIIIQELPDGVVEQSQDVRRISNLTNDFMSGNRKPQKHTHG